MWSCPGSTGSGPPPGCGPIRGPGICPSRSSAPARSTRWTAGSRAGVDAFLAKPFEPAELVRLVRRLMRAGGAARRRSPGDACRARGHRRAEVPGWPAESPPAARRSTGPPASSGWRNRFAERTPLLPYACPVTPAELSRTVLHAVRRAVDEVSCASPCPRGCGSSGPGPAGAGTTPPTSPCSWPGPPALPRPRGRRDPAASGSSATPGIARRRDHRARVPEHHASTPRRRPRAARTRRCCEQGAPVRARGRARRAGPSARATPHEVRAAVVADASHASCAPRAAGAHRLHGGRPDWARLASTSTSADARRAALRPCPPGRRGELLDRLGARRRPLGPAAARRPRPAPLGADAPRPARGQPALPGPVRPRPHPGAQPQRRRRSGSPRRRTSRATSTRPPLLAPPSPTTPASSPPPPATARPTGSPGTSSAIADAFLAFHAHRPAASATRNPRPPTVPGWRLPKPPGRCWPVACPCSASAHPNTHLRSERAQTMSRSAHPAGPRHADVLPEGHYAAPPADLNALDPKVWARTVDPRRRRRRHRRRASTSRRSPRSSARPPTSSTRPTSGPAAAPGATPSGRTPTSSTPGRRSCPAPSCAGCTRRGSTSTSAPAASSPPRSPPGCPPSASPSTATTSPTDEIHRAVEAGVGRIVLDSFQEIVRVAHIAAAARQAPAGPDPGHRRRRGAHARVHRHRPRGPEVRHPARRRAGRRGRAAGAASSTGSSSSASTRTSGRRSSTRPASRSPPTASSGCSSRDPRRARRRAARDRPRRRPRHRVHLRRRPARAARDRQGAQRDRHPRVRGRRARARRGSPSSRAAPSSGPPPSRCTRSAPSSRSTGCVRTSASTAACPTTSAPRCTTPSTASRWSPGPPTPSRCSSRVVGKHCESGDIVVQGRVPAGRPGPRRPDRRPGHRRVLPLHGEQLQPRAAPAGRRRAGRRGAGDRPAGDGGGSSAARCRVMDRLSDGTRSVGIVSRSVAETVGEIEISDPDEGRNSRPVRRLVHTVDGMRNEVG